MNKIKLRAQTCCFTGHREIFSGDEIILEKWLEKTISWLYLYNGVRYFGSGGAIGFDIFAAEVVLRLMRKHPDIKLVLVLPCPLHDKFWNEEWKQRFARIAEQASKIVYTSDRYHDCCMHIRNRHLINHSEWCIAYCRKYYGGTAYTVSYAKEKQRKIICFPVDEIV